MAYIIECTRNISNETFAWLLLTALILSFSSALAIFWYLRISFQIVFDVDEDYLRYTGQKYGNCSINPLEDAYELSIHITSEGGIWETLVIGIIVGFIFCLLYGAYFLLENYEEFSQYDIEAEIITELQQRLSRKIEKLRKYSIQLWHEPYVNILYIKLNE